jgi:acid phosphatase
MATISSTGRLAACILLLAVVAFAAVPKNVVFTVIGDWGVPNLGKTYLDKMAKISTDRNSQFTIAIGDNFYKANTDKIGVSSTTDPKWKTVFEDQFTQAFFKKPWYVIAGNHDYDANEKAQVDYSTLSNRWNFPSMYYNFTKRMAKGVSVQFFMIDSHVLYTSKSELEATYGRTRDEKQLKWIARELKRSKATWKIMFSHHPLHNDGHDRWFNTALEPLLNEHNVALFINGHVHTFEYAKTKKVNYFTVGSTAIQGARPPIKSPGLRRVYSYPSEELMDRVCAKSVEKPCRGFVVITVLGKRFLVVHFYNATGKEVKSFKIENTNLGRN